MLAIVDVIGAYRQSYISGATTGVAASTASAGHIFSKQFVPPASSNIGYRLRAIEVEGLTTTAFTAAQEMGYDITIARAFTAAPTGATVITPLATNDGKKRTAYPNSQFVTAGDIRIASTGAMTVGTLTFDGQPIARGSAWMGAVGAKLGANRHDFSAIEPGGELLARNEGFVVRNSVAMGAAGVFVWKITVDWEEVILGN